MWQRLLKKIKDYGDTKGIETKYQAHTDAFYSEIVKQYPCIAIYYSLDGMTVNPIYKVDNRYVTLCAQVDNTVSYYVIHSTSIKKLISHIKFHLSNGTQEGKTIYIKQPQQQDNNPTDNAVNQQAHRTHDGMETNLAKLVGLLSKVDLNSEALVLKVNGAVNKLKIDNLSSVKWLIDDYLVYYCILDEIYAELDKQGINKSLSIFQDIKKRYQISKNAGISPVEIFYGIIDELISVVKQSDNYIELPEEELQMYISMIVVDAYVKDKFF